MKNLAVGILAHVDAGKTTLSEGLLYCSGALKKLGRVDHRDAFLDTHAIERERGITIFSKQAIFSLGDRQITLLDTPGHVDFSSEMERTLQVLDCAVLVVSGTDGVQSHTETLWRLLARYQIPTFLFVNKMDLPAADHEALLAELRQRLSDGCVDFGAPRAAVCENAALCSEQALAHYLEAGTLTDAELAGLVAERALFPCFFGSALRLEGVDTLLDGLRRYAPHPRYPEDFSARVYKISRDAQGARLTWLKVTGGRLRVKDVLHGGTDAEPWAEKVDQIRLYSGARFRAVDEVDAGTVCAVTGLSHTAAGQGLGGEKSELPPLLEPVLTYRVGLPDGVEPHAALRLLSQLEEEDPQLHMVWNEQLHEIHMQLMGAVQLEVLKRIIAERFGLDVEFGTGSIVYRETVAAPVLGAGHYEPLRHYAEVHLLLQPLPRGSGLQFDSACSGDSLDLTWQRLILTHLAERSHPGVLTGSPITDMRITLVAGRGHIKHTEGGDFRQATYRAVRHGLMHAQNVLLEPWYSVRLELPAEQVGRAMADIQRMSGVCDPPEHLGETAVLTGAAPVSAMHDYAAEVAAYTRGRGRLSCTLRGYEPCHNQDEVVASIGYDPERDLENPADSIFCAHGAGFVVPWEEASSHMHVSPGVSLRPPAPAETADVKDEPPQERRTSAYSGTAEQDKELEAIFERTYGPVRRRELREIFEPVRRAPSDDKPYVPAPRAEGPEYLLVDGYNIIYAWDELKAVAQSSMDTARQMLIDLMINYQGFRKNHVIIVFDAYKVPRGQAEVLREHDLFIVFTKEAETADAYIEKTTYELGRRHRVRVATSDNAESLIILGHGALRLSARQFHDEVESVMGQIADIVSKSAQRGGSDALRTALERAGKEKRE